MKLESLTEEEWQTSRPPFIIPQRLRELGGLLELVDRRKLVFDVVHDDLLEDEADYSWS